jgi:hypothetical protein
VKRFVFIFVCLVAAAGFLPAQTVDTTVCDILAHPKSFDGKMVRIKGTVIAGFDEFVVKDASCKQPVNAIWLAYPAGSKAKAGPAAVVQLQLARNSSGQTSEASRVPVVLDKSKDFKQFDSLLAAPFKGPGRCLGCPRSTVTATLTGSLDGVDGPGLVKDASGMFTSVKGFGNLTRYSARLVLQSVADVEKHDIDYSKAAALPKSNPDPDSGSDPVAAAHKAAKAFGAGNPFGEQIERAATAFGAPAKDNGVTVSFSGGSEVPNEDGEKPGVDSTDGLRFIAIFDKDRLKGTALQEAIAHTGTHIADFREGKLDGSLFELEENAWKVTFFSAAANRDNSLTLPGGYVTWNIALPQDERANSMTSALVGYLTGWAALAQ